jgi:hypothetical protein
MKQRNGRSEMTADRLGSLNKKPGVAEQLRTPKQGPLTQLCTLRALSGGLSYRS